MSTETVASLLAELLDTPRLEPSALLYCRCCGQAITANPYRIRIDGEHQHRFINPAAAIFDVCCFQRAPGASVCGEASAEYSWFRGFDWQYARCEECDTHLGWYYHSQSLEGRTLAFFGLIPDALRSLQ